MSAWDQSGHSHALIQCPVGNSGDWPDFESETLKTVFPLGRAPDFLWPLVPGSRADCN